MPIGSRISWVHDGATENTVKIKNDRYLLNYRGLKQKVFTEQELRKLFGERAFVAGSTIPSNLYSKYKHYINNVNEEKMLKKKGVSK